MQIGIDLGATKIESVLLKENGLELHRDRIPVSYTHLTLPTTLSV